MSKVKKVQVVPVTSGNESWQSLSREQSGSKEPDHTSSDAFNVNLLDYMNSDEFLSLLKQKTENNYDGLWHASRTLAMQLKSAKAILTLNSYMGAGKSKNEILEKLVESTKFTLNADHVHIVEFHPAEHSLVVTHSSNIGAVNIHAPLDGSLEGDVLSSGRIMNVSSTEKGGDYIGMFDDSSVSTTEYALCCPFLIDGEVMGVIKACRNTGNTPSIPFDVPDESLIGYIASNIGYVMKYSTLNISHKTPTKSRGQLLFANNSNSPSQQSQPQTNNQVTTLYNIDEMIQWIIQTTYKNFSADRVSVFCYNSACNELECIVSQDAVGMKIPIKSGIAGHVFTTQVIENIGEAEKDSRFYAAVDSQTKYKTHSILCAPIIGYSGHSIGVIQVINKEGGFNAEDEKMIAEVSGRLSVLLQSKMDAETCHLEKIMFSSLATSIYQILSASSEEEMSSSAKVSLQYLVEADYVEIFNFVSVDGQYSLKRIGQGDATSSGFAVVARGSGVKAVSSINQLSPRAALPGVSDVIKNLPKEILDCVRRGDATTYTAPDIGAENPPEFLPGLSPQVAMVFPVGSKIFVGDPCKSVMVVARTKSIVPFSSVERQALDVFVELLGCSMSTFSRIKTIEAGSKKAKYELNMIVNALKLLHNYVMLLDADGNVTACNRSIQDVVGSDRNVNCHLSLWFNDEQKVLRDDLLDALKTGKHICKDCVHIRHPKHENGLFISYQVCPVNKRGEIHEDHSVCVPVEEIGSVILILHTHSNDEEGVKKLRKVLTGKACSSRELDTNTVSGTVDAVTQVICEIGGRFNLGREEQTTVNQMAANMMQMSRNMRVSMVNGEKKLDPSLIDNCRLVTDEASKIEDLFTWDFDVNKYDKSTLRGVLGRLFESMFNLSEIQVNPKTLASFLREAEKHYHDNPFHNFYHITCVTHFSYMLINATNGKDLLDQNMYYIFSIMASAVVHDIDHPGNSNLFEINSKSELALLYNDQSVLENHHCSMAFRIMRYNNTDILGEMPPNAHKDVKKTIVSCILATDMSVHFELIDKIKKKVTDGWDMTEPGDIFFYCRIMLHAADLSNPVRPFELSKLWASRISAEFNNQVDIEKKLGLPVLGFMITPDEKTLCKNEIGFASFVVAPMWRNLELLFSNFKPLVEQLNKNLDMWKLTLDNISKEEDSKKMNEGSTTDAK